MSNTCEQLVVLSDGATIPCGRACEYIFSKKLRSVGASVRTYKFCGVHRRLRRIHGADSQEAMRPAIETTEHEEKKESV